MIDWVARPLRIIYVEWDDAADEAGWMNARELETWRGTRHLVRETGYVLEDTDDHLILSAAWGPETPFSPEAFAKLTRIPKTWIRRRVELGRIVDGEFVQAGKGKRGR
jgi:hypothetical protein